VPVRTFADSRLQELLRSKCTEELLQAIYRIRPLSVHEDPSGQGQFGFERAPNEPRRRAKIYLFSSMPLPELRVQLAERPRPQSPAPVVELRQAAEAMIARGERMSQERLARAAASNRHQARKFMATLPAVMSFRSALGSLGPPPAHAPPDQVAAS
jgi:hypothetical protein